MKLVVFILLQVLLYANSQENLNLTIDYDYDDPRFGGIKTSTTKNTPTPTPPTPSPPTPTPPTPTPPTPTPPTPDTPTPTPPTPSPPTPTPPTPSPPTPTPPTPTPPTPTPPTPDTPTPTPPTPSPPTPTPPTPTPPTPSPPTPTPPTPTPPTPDTPTPTPPTPPTPTATNTPSPPTKKPLTPQESLAVGLTTIRSLKVQFENKFSLDNDYINKFSDRLNSFRSEFYAALDEEVYKLEYSKRSTLQSALRNNPDSDCIRGHEDAVNSAKRQGIVEFDNCEQAVKIRVQQQKNGLSFANQRVQDEIKKANLLVENCKRLYVSHYDLPLYTYCTDALTSNLVNAVSVYNVSIHGEETKKRVIELAACADSSLKKIETGLNENYGIIKKCLATSNNPSTKNVITTFIDTYTVDLSSLFLKGQIETSINSLKTNVEQTVQGIVRLKATFQETKTIRDRGQSDIRDVLEVLDVVNKYRLAYLQAERDLTPYNKAKDCIYQGNNKVQDNLNSRSSEIRDCVRKYNLVPTEGTVNELQSNTRNRDLTEGLIGIVNCFANRKTTLKSNITASCSAALDGAFQSFIAGIDKQLQFYFQQFDQLDQLFDDCYKAVLPRLSSQLEIDGKVFESCVLMKAFVTYKLKV